MTVSEYCDLISDLADCLSSAKSAANPDERAAETKRLCAKIAALRNADCRVVRPSDIIRAHQIINMASDFIQQQRNESSVATIQFTQSELSALLEVAKAARAAGHDFTGPAQWAMDRINSNLVALTDKRAQSNP